MSFNKSDFHPDPIRRQERINRTFRADREKYFGKPKAPEAPPPPVIEDAEARRQDEGDRIRRRRGRDSMFLSGRSTSAPTTASKVLLGS